MSASPRNVPVASSDAFHTAPFWEPFALCRVDSRRGHILERLLVIHTSRDRARAGGAGPGPGSGALPHALSGALAPKASAAGLRARAHASRPALRLSGARDPLSLLLARAEPHADSRGPLGKHGGAGRRRVREDPPGGRGQRGGGHRHPAFGTVRRAPGALRRLPGRDRDAGLVEAGGTRARGG